jgi:hypothetical protein
MLRRRTDRFPARARHPERGMGLLHRLRHNIPAGHREAFPLIPGIRLHDHHVAGLLNRFAPVATEADFASRTLLRGEAMVADARSAAPHMLGELPGFIADMDAAGPWEPVPILLAMAEPNGPVEQAFFNRMMAEWERPCSGTSMVWARCMALASRRDHDPEGTLLTLVRRIVGTYRWSPATTFTPTSRTPTSNPERLHHTAPTRISTCASAALNPRRCCAGSSAARRPTSRTSACRSCRPPSPC